MKSRAILFSLLAGGALLAQGLPARPEQIKFQPLAFAVPRPEAYQARLDNGITVFLAADPAGVPFVRMTVLVKAGSYQDPRGKEGLARLAGDQLRDGGTRTTPAGVLDERLEFLAGSINSGFGITSGALSMEFLDKDLPEGLDLFMQVLTQPAFAQERLARAKDGLLEEFMARNDRVADLARAEQARLLNGEGHFASAQPTAASVAAITREDLAAFHARVLHPDNLVVSVSGRFQREAMLAQLNRTIGRLQAGPAAQASASPQGPESRPTPGLYLVDKDVPQSMVRFALPGLRRTDPDWHAAVVLNQILGGSGFTSRLTKKIRSDEGLTYGIGTGFGEGPYWKGNWTGSFQTKNRSVAYALRLVLAELDRIKTEPVPEQELKGIKDAILEAFPSQWSRKKVVVDTFAQERLTGWPEHSWTDYRDKIAAVTAADVQRVARTYLDPAQLVILVVGKAKEVEAGDGKDHPGLLKDLLPLPMSHLPLRDPMTLQPRS